MTDTGRSGPAEGPDGGPAGLQRERTLLAWNRTMLALLVVVALLARATGPPYLRTAHLPAAAVGVLTVALSLVADHRYRAGSRAGRIVSPALLRVLAVGVVLVGAAGTWVLLA